MRDVIFCFLNTVLSDLCVISPGGKDIGQCIRNQDDTDDPESNLQCTKRIGKNKNAEPRRRNTHDQMYEHTSSGSAYTYGLDDIDDPVDQDTKSHRHGYE